MKDLVLMYVCGAYESGIELSTVSGSLGCLVPFDLPEDCLRNLIGRHVWVKGSSGAPCKIVNWPDLPLPPRPTKEAAE